MVAQLPLPKAAYDNAANTLANASPNDGDAMLIRAEVLLNTGRTASDVVPLLVDGLRHAPASARGWTLLAEAQQPLQPTRAATALSQAFLLAPRDYWIAAARVRAAGLLWPSLDGETRAAAEKQSRLLWQEELLRPQLVVAAQTNEGAALLTRSFREEEIRDVSRYISAARRRPR
jgi:predicted Zn-dependent protease